MAEKNANDAKWYRTVASVLMIAGIAIGVLQLAGVIRL